MTTTCPACNKPITIEESEMEYHRSGRQAKCPLCRKSIIFTRRARGLKYDENGSLTRRFKKV